MSFKSIIIDDGEDFAGAILGTRYRRYHSKTGIRGLYRVDADKLNLLVVDADNPGTGQFRRFMSECKKEFAVICVWQIGNPWLEKVLERYGFRPQTEIQGDGEVVTGMRWDRA